MTAPHAVDPAGLLRKVLSQASPDLVRSLLQSTINAYLCAHADADAMAVRFTRIGGNYCTGRLVWRPVERRANPTTWLIAKGYGQSRPARWTDPDHADD